MATARFSFGTRRSAFLWHPPLRIPPPILVPSDPRIIEALELLREHRGCQRKLPAIVVHVIDPLPHLTFGEGNCTILGSMRREHVGPRVAPPSELDGAELRLE